MFLILYLNLNLNLYRPHVRFKLKLFLNLILTRAISLKTSRFIRNFELQSTFIMTTMIEKQEEHLKNLGEIRSLMERSSRFISLSGLSGVAAGLMALIGAFFAYLYTGMTPFDSKIFYLEAINSGKWGLNYQTFFLLDFGLVLISALACGIFFTTRKAKRKGQKIWDKLVVKLLVSLAIPLLAGAIFCVALNWHGSQFMIAPTTLIFYGMALINGSKHTLRDIYYLGITEVALGLIALFLPGYGLDFWAVGFGVMHIVYGLLMWVKYEK